MQIILFIVLSGGLITGGLLGIYGKCLSQWFTGTLILFFLMSIVLAVFKLLPSNPAIVGIFQLLMANIIIFFPAYILGRGLRSLKYGFGNGS